MDGKLALAIGQFLRRERKIHTFASLHTRKMAAPAEFTEQCLQAIFEKGLAVEGDVSGAVAAVLDNATREGDNAFIAGSAHPSVFDLAHAASQPGWKAATMKLADARAQFGYSSDVWGTLQQWAGLDANIKAHEVTKGTRISVTRPDDAAGRWMTETFEVYNADQVEFRHGAEETESVPFDGENGQPAAEKGPEVVYCRFVVVAFRCRL